MHAVHSPDACFSKAESAPASLERGAKAKHSLFLEEGDAGSPHHAEWMIANESSEEALDGLRNRRQVLEDLDEVLENIRAPRFLDFSQMLRDDQESNPAEYEDHEASLESGQLPDGLSEEDEFEHLDDMELRLELGAVHCQDWAITDQKSSEVFGVPDPLDFSATYPPNSTSKSARKHRLTPSSAAQRRPFSSSFASSSSATKPSPSAPFTPSRSRSRSDPAHTPLSHSSSSSRHHHACSASSRPSPPWSLSRHSPASTPTPPLAPSSSPAALPRTSPSASRRSSPSTPSPSLQRRTRSSAAAATASGGGGGGLGAATSGWRVSRGSGERGRRWGRGRRRRGCGAGAWTRPT